MPDDTRTWVKSSRSMGSGACIELTAHGDTVTVRNSRDHSVEIQYTRAELVAFLDGAKRGEFDHLVED
jgi:hypothetical protein